MHIHIHVCVYIDMYICIYRHIYVYLCIYTGTYSKGEEFCFIQIYFETLFQNTPCSLSEKSFTSEGYLG